MTLSARQRKLLQDKRERAEAQERLAKEGARTAKQRSTFEALPDSDEKHLLKLAMLERAWWLLDEVRVEEADVILEFLPEVDALRLLEEYFFTEHQFDENLYLHETLHL